MRLTMMIGMALLTTAVAAEGKSLAPAAVVGPNFTATISVGGGMTVEINRTTYRVESIFSYPNMKPQGWNRLAVDERLAGPWAVSLASKGDGVEITGTGKHYRLLRQVSLEKDHLVIRDTFTNRTASALGIVFKNTVTADTRPKRIDMGGTYKKTFFPYTAADPAWNPTVFLAGDKHGLGMVAVDDYYRLQLDLTHDSTSGTFGNRSFGLPAGDSYTFVWALYPVQSSDYYDFINPVRRDYVPNYPIEGSCSFLCYTLPLEWPRQKMADWLKHRAAKILILCGPNSGGPWLGEDSNFTYHVPNFKLDKYLATLKKVRAILKDIDPTVKCVAPFETALSPDLAPGDVKVQFADSISVLPDGSPAGYRWPEDPKERKKYLATQGHQYIYYPTLTNSYYKWIRQRILRGLKDADMDGIYFDLFSYGYGDHGFRWTYDRWDNRTVDMDLTTYTIKRKKADMCKLTEDARAELVKMILGCRKGNVVVANDMGVATKIRELPILHFSECIADYGYTKCFFSTPIILGYTRGYAAGAKEIGKEGTWWQTWKTDKDFFEDIKDKLAYACVYYTYAAPPGDYLNTSLTHPTILDHMFPITIEELHAGWIKGKERIITLHPGTYTWNDASAVKGYFYDAGGKACPGSLETVAKNGKNQFMIGFPKGGAAVLVKE